MNKSVDKIGKCPQCKEATKELYFDRRDDIPPVKAYSQTAQKNPTLRSQRVDAAQKPTT